MFFCAKQVLCGILLLNIFYKKMAEKKKVEKKVKKDDTTAQKKKVVKNLDSVGVVDYLQYLQSPFKIFWTNFLAGVSRGFGIIVGMSVVVGLVIWILARMAAFPLIGEYSQKMTNAINDYMESTNYTDEFESMQKTLQNIEKNTAGE
jgi:hypothetical protein